MLEEMLQHVDDRRSSARRHSLSDAPSFDFFDQLRLDPDVDIGGFPFHPCEVRRCRAPRLITPAKNLIRAANRRGLYGRNPACVPGYDRLYFRALLGRSPRGGEQNGLHRGVDGSGTEFLRQRIGDRVGDLFETTRCVLLDMGAQNPAVTIGDRRFLRRFRPRALRQFLDGHGAKACHLEVGARGGKVEIRRRKYVCRPT